MNYFFMLRSESGSGYKIDCRFGRLAAINFASALLAPEGDGNVLAVFGEHEAKGHSMFVVGKLGSFELVAVKE